MMETVLFVYRILLPPLLLFRLCLSRPSEAESRSLITNNVLLYGGKHETQNSIEKLFFEMRINNRNESNTSALNAITSGKIIKETVMLKQNLERSNKTNNFTSIAKINHSDSRKEGIHTFPTIRLSSRRFSRHTRDHNVTLRDEVRNVFSLSSLTINRLKNKTLTKQNVVPLNEVLSDIRLQLPFVSKSNSSNTSSFGYNARSRARREMRETLLSNRFKHLSPRQIAPEYMIRLFQLLSGTHYHMMRNVVVTGFVNINDDEDYLEGSGSTLRQAHQLMFDVSIQQQVETMQYAELRLHVALKSRETGTEYSNETNIERISKFHNISIFEVDPHFGHRLIAFRSVQNAHRTWVSFNVTSAVQQWEISGLRVLEARVSVSGNRTEIGESNYDFDDEKIVDCVLDIDVEEGKEPLLVVFSKKSQSDDPVTHKINKRNTGKGRVNEINIDNDFPYIHSLLANEQNFEDLVKSGSTGQKDTLNNFSSERDSLSENSPTVFSNDNQRYDTDKKNTRYRNVGSRTFVMNKSSEGRVNHKQKTEHINAHNSNSTLLTTILLHENLESTSAENEKMKSDDSIRLRRLKKDLKSRYRRHLDSLFQEQLTSVNRGRFKRSKKKRNSCQRGELYVDFETIKWDKVIIFPRGYQAFECTGKCFTPISEYLTPTKHAIIQTLVHTSYPDQASRACCVPTKLEPISLLYWDDNGDIKYDYSHEGMVVAECGCR